MFTNTLLFNSDVAISGVEVLPKVGGGNKGGARSLMDTSGGRKGGNLLIGP